MVLCDACKRREAVYVRTYSGQRLCSVCLRRTLERAIRRAVGEAGGLPPKSRVAVPVSFTAPHFSLALADVASRVERHFGSKLMLLLPRQVEVDDPAALRDNDIDLVELNVAPPEKAGLGECLRFDTAWAARAASALGADAVFLPVTLTDRILLVLDALLRGELWMIPDFSISRQVGQVRVIYAFGTVEGEVVAAHTARLGVRAWSPCRVDTPSKRVFYSVASKRPELEYSMVKTAAGLSTLTGGGATCSSCGGVMPRGWSGSACPVCLRLKPSERLQL